MDFVSTFMNYTQGIASPSRFRLWSAIGAVAGAMERRVFTTTTGKPAFPNLFILLVGGPGTGKSESIMIVEELWMEAGGLFVASNNVTKAALIDELFESKRNIYLDEQTLLEYHSLLVAAPEFGVLVPAHDLEFLSVLNYVWDNPKFYREKRRGLKSIENEKGVVDIPKPNITILGGTQPGWLSSVLPEEAWTMGTMARTIMAYSAEKIDVPLFDTNLRDPKLFQDLVTILRRITGLMGPMTWDPETMTLIEEWRRGGLVPVPKHSKLLHYSARRMFMTIKLCIVASASRGVDMVILPEDFIRARKWLLDIETVMPDVFRDMAGKSDKAVMDELYTFGWKIFMDEKKPVHKGRLLGFIANRVPSEKAERILDLCTSMGMFIDRGEGLYEPGQNFTYGVE